MHPPGLRVQIPPIFLLLASVALIEWGIKARCCAESFCGWGGTPQTPRFFFACGGPFSPAAGLFFFSSFFGNKEAELFSINYFCKKKNRVDGEETRRISNPRCTRAELLLQALLWADLPKFQIPSKEEAKKLDHRFQIQTKHNCARKEGRRRKSRKDGMTHTDFQILAHETSRTP